MKTVQKTLNQLVVGSNPTGVTVDNNSPEVYNKSLMSPEIVKSGDAFVPSPLFDSPLEIFYVRGGDKTAPTICQQSGMKYGIRNDYTAYAPIHMLDIRWKAYNWQNYLAKVRAHNPALVMVPDFENLSQLDTLLQQIEDLRSVGIKVLVCPKFVGAVQYIPHDCRIAISVETSYAGYEPAPSEVAGRELHLLGGHPDQQAYMINHKYKNAAVASVDGNILGYKAALGQMWALSGRWEKASGITLELAVKSAKNVITYLNTPAPTIKPTRRVMRSAQAPMFHGGDHA